MIEVRIISHSDIKTEWLENFKAYASIADNGRDAMLQMILKSAILKIQEMADESILDCTIEVVDTAPESAEMRLYQSVDAVVRVTDGNGNILAYKQNERQLHLAQIVDIVKCEYTTLANPAMVDALLLTAYQYATFVYDGDYESAAKVLRNV